MNQIEYKSPRVSETFSSTEVIMYSELKRKCRRCKEEKPESEYSVHKQRKNGSWSLRANCKQCNVKVVGEWFQKNKEKNRIVVRERYRNNAHVRERVRNEGFKRTYGITVADYDKMFELQKGNCAICGEHQSKFERRFDIDHCHETGKIRGLCCIRCNRGLGLFKDKPLLLKNAIAYLEKFKN